MHKSVLKASFHRQLDRTLDWYHNGMITKDECKERTSKIYSHLAQIERLYK